jgi:membrane-bound lytic murein transglycosylase D
MHADSAAAVAAATAEDAPVPPIAIDAPLPAGIDVSKFELPIQYNERVQQYIDLYAYRRRAVFASWLRRMGRYRAYIEERLAAHGLPSELVYLPMIESGYETSATSNQSAVGVWQFMAGTARSEGLEVSEWVDERRDPFRSTDAAIRHLAGLHNMFGSWYLAAAAYNSGSGRIARLLKEYGRNKGPDETFWEMQDALPQETRGYVPGLLAAVIIGEYPQLFGLDDVVQEAPVQFETVMVSPSTDLRAVARAASTTAEIIRGLNPQYFRGATPPDRESVVRVPTGAARGFAAALARIPADERVAQTKRTHIVREGETLSGIAVRYGTTVEALQKANRIKRPELVGAGRKLVIPVDVSQKVYGTD